MAANTVHCPLCSKAFFRTSLPIHVKQCQRKMAKLPIPCLHCHEEVPHEDMPAHLSRCKTAKKAQQSLASGVNPKLIRPAASSQGTGRVVGDGGGVNGSSRGGGGGSGDGISGLALAGGLRVGCRVVLEGLVAKPELNGATGTVCGPFDEGKVRAQPVSLAKTTSSLCVPTPVPPLLVLACRRVCRAGAVAGGPR